MLGSFYQLFRPGLSAMLDNVACFADNVAPWRRRRQRQGWDWARTRMEQLGTEPPGDVSDRWSSLPRRESYCVTYRVRVATRKIGFVNAILESYGDIARVQTENIGAGVLSMVVPEEWDAVFLQVMRSMGRRIEMEFLPLPLREA